MGTRNLKRKTLIPHSKLSPSQTANLRHQAEAHQEAGRFSQAAACLKKILKATPHEAEIYNDLGLIFDLQKNFSQAAQYYAAAIKIKPALASAHYNLGNMEHLRGNTAAALACYQKASTFDPSNVDALHNAAVILYDQGRVREALDFFQKAKKISPSRADLTSAIASALNYLPDIPPEEELAAAKAWWFDHGKAMHRRLVFSNKPTTERPIKIGLISPDFRQHSVSYFILPFLREHNPDILHISCYADLASPDKVSEECEELCDQWLLTHQLSNTELARRIEEDGIDMLIDLCGHMVRNRLMVFALQPAPIQISWLGYPNTAGLPTIHYRITDSIADPPGTTDPFYTEELIRFPKVFLCYGPPKTACEITTPPSQTKGYITFGSFNNPAKMSSPTIDTWATILKKCPGSKLTLKGLLLGDSATREHYLSCFAARGVNPAHINLLAFVDSEQEHLLLYNDIDICLDPFPYNGTTTTCEALWMGTPVITLAGDRHASRVGASILHSLDLNELICNSQDDYINKALNLAQSPATLKRHKSTLRETLISSSLCDAKQFSREVEKNLTQIWQQWCTEHAA